MKLAAELTGLIVLSQKGAIIHAANAHIQGGSGTHQEL